MRFTCLLIVLLMLIGIGACTKDDPDYLTGPVEITGDNPGDQGKQSHEKGDPGGPDITSAAPEIGGISNVGIFLVEFANTPSNKRFDADDRAEIMNFMFDDTPGANSVHNLFQEMSYGVDGFTGEIIGTYEITWDYFNPCPGMDLWTYFGWNEEAMDSAAAHGVVIDPDDYDLLVFMTPSGGSCDGAFANGPNGVAYRMSSVYSPDIPEVSIFNWDVYATTAHEIGHIRGFGHSGVPGMNAYADLSCVMGDNYDYDYGGQVVPLPMRQVNGYWKYYAGYFAPEVIHEQTNPGGTYTFYLAPTERASTDIEHPPGETAYQMVILNSINQSTPYYLSFRSSDPAYTDFDDAAVLSEWMDRIHVQTASSDAYRQALLEMNQSYEGENFKVTAVTDGLGGDPWVEVTVEMYDKLAPSLSLDPLYYFTNNGSIGIAPETYELTVTNNDPAYIGPTTFDLSGTASPDIFTVEFSSQQITLDPGQSGSVTVSLNFTSPPEEGSNVATITVSDPIGPRSDASISASYFVDLTPPTDPTGLTGVAGPTSASLSWNASDDNYAFLGITYYIERNGDIVGNTTETEYVDEGLEPGNTYEYRVMAYDGVGNPSGWSNLLVLSTDCANGFASDITPAVVYRTTPVTRPGHPMGTFSVTLTNNNPPGCAPIQYTVTGTCSAPNYYFQISTPTLAGGETQEFDADLLWYVYPWVPPTDGTVAINATIDDDNPDIPAQTFDLTFVYDTVDPTEPGDLTATVTASDVTLTWTASFDATSGVSHYEVFRDGNSLGTTTDLSYTDNFVVTTCATYEVRAYDAAGRYSTDAGVDVGGAPTVWIEPATLVTGETTFDVTLFITNNDDAGCGSATFDITPALSPDLTVSTAVSQLVVDPGETESTTATVTITDTPANGDYTIEIGVVDASTPRVAQTASATYTVDTVDPTAPTGLAAQMSPWDEVTLTWNAASDDVSGVAYYEIQRNDVVIDATTELSYLDHVDVYQALWYRVRAVDNAGNTGPWSKKVKTGCPGCPKPIEG